MDKKIKILVVDDEQSTREMYAEVFRSSGMEVAEAEDGMDGLEKATKDVPDIVFTGIIMPKLDGFGLMEALKKNVITSGVPVVISSHLGREVDKQKANQLGARDFFVLNFTPPNEVVARIKAIFTEGGVYRIAFDAMALDAQQLAKDLNLNNGFQCVECNEKMVLEMKLKSPQEKIFESRLICPKCGWEAK
jgi:two-component system chemotaxis response regulator CheY